MSKTHFILACDWHVAITAWAHSDIVWDSHVALEAVIEICLERRAHLLAGGDLFDNAFVSGLSRGWVRHLIARMAAAGLGVYFIQGQHDRVRPLSPEQMLLSYGVVQLPDGRNVAPVLWDIHRHARYIDDRMVEVGPYRVYARDWQPPTKIPEMLAAIPPDADIFLGHQVCREFMGDHIETELTIADIPHVSAALLGDFHQEMRLELVRPDGTRLLAYSPGSICMQSINEPEEKAVLAFGDDLANPERIALPARFCRRVAVADLAELEDLVVHGIATLEDEAAAHAVDLPPCLRRGLLQVSYPDDLDGAYVRLMAACEGRFHLFPKLVRRAAVTAADEAQAEAMRALAAGGMLAAVGLVAPPGTVRDDVVRLLKAADPNVELEAICREYKG